VECLEHFGHVRVEGVAFLVEVELVQLHGELVVQSSYLKPPEVYFTVGLHVTVLCE